MGSVWSWGHVYVTESFQREKTQRRPRGWWETVPGTSLCDACSQMLLALGHPRGQMWLVSRCPLREELMFVCEHINIYKCGENEESLDVDSSFSPLEKSWGQTCLLLFMGGWVHVCIMKTRRYLDCLCVILKLRMESSKGEPSMMFSLKDDTGFMLFPPLCPTRMSSNE